MQTRKNRPASCLFTYNINFLRKNSGNLLIVGLCLSNYIYKERAVVKTKLETINESSTAIHYCRISARSSSS